MARAMPPLVSGLTEPEEKPSDNPLEMLTLLGMGDSGQGLRPSRRKSSANRLTREILDKLEILAEMNPRLSPRIRKAVEVLTESEETGGDSSYKGGSTYASSDVKTPI